MFKHLRLFTRRFIACTAVLGLATPPGHAFVAARPRPSGACVFASQALVARFVNSVAPYGPSIRIDEIRDAHGPALSLSGFGLETLEFPLGGAIVRLRLHALFNMALDDTAGKSTSTSLSRWLKSIFGDRAKNGGSAKAIAFLNDRIAVHTSKRPRLVSVDGLHRTYRELLLRSIRLQVTSLVSERRIEALATALSDDIWVHAGTRGERREPLIYVDSLRRPWLESLPADIFLRIIIHELNHLARRLEEGRHPPEQNVRFDEYRLEHQFGLSPLEAWSAHLPSHAGAVLLNTLFRRRILAPVEQNARALMDSAQKAAESGLPDAKDRLIRARRALDHLRGTASAVHDGKAAILVGSLEAREKELSRRLDPRIVTEFWVSTLYQAALLGRAAVADWRLSHSSFENVLDKNYPEAGNYLKTYNLRRLLRMIEQLIAPTEQVIEFVVNPMRSRLATILSKTPTQQSMADATILTLRSGLERWKRTFALRFVRKGKGYVVNTSDTEAEAARIVRTLETLMNPLLSLSRFADRETFLDLFNERVNALVEAIRAANARAAEGEPLIMAVTQESPAVRAST